MADNSVQKIDQVIGNNIRIHRSMKGMSRKMLAKALDISGQQLRKYEMAENRISASRLSEIAEILEVPVNSFYSDVAIPIGRTNPDTTFMANYLGLSRAVRASIRLLVSQLPKMNSR